MPCFWPYIFDGLRHRGKLDGFKHGDRFKVLVNFFIGRSIRIHGLDLPSDVVRNHA